VARPDFSGKWTLDREASHHYCCYAFLDYGHTGAVVIFRDLVLTQHDDVIEISQDNGAQATIQLDGTPVVIPNSLHGPQTTSARWDGNALVLSTTLGALPATVMEQSFVLREGLLIIDTTSSRTPKQGAGHEEFHRRLQAAGAACAARQSMFGPMHDRLYRDQHHIDKEDLLQAADSLKIDRGLFASCLAGPTPLEVTADSSEAARLGITRTPTFLIGAVEANDHVARNR
jgi:hypothetical protein